MKAFVAVGANIEPEHHIEAALRGLMGMVDVHETSTFYRTTPLLDPRQPDFLNGVWRIETELGPRDLKYDILRGIERDLGRERSGNRYAPRVIDLDLILWGDAVIDEPDLKIPDPDIYTRPFVAVPLAELSPELELPDTKSTVSDLESAKRHDGLEALEAFTAHLKRCIEK